MRFKFISPLGLVLPAILVATGLIYLGYLSLVILIVLGGWGLALTWRWPLPAAGVAMLLSTDVFQFYSLEYLPRLQLTGGIRLNALDVILFLLLFISVIRLVTVRRRPLFLFPVLIVLGLAIFSLVLGTIAGTTSLHTGVNELRAASGFLFYLGLSGNIDTPRRVRWLVWFVYALVFFSVAIQGFEVIRGQRLITPYSTASDYYSTTKLIKVGGSAVPYLWNRAVAFLFLGLFLAWGPFLHRKGGIGYLLVVLVAVLGFILALSRSWYIYLAAGILFTLVLSIRAGSRTVPRVLLALLVFTVAVIWYQNANLGASHNFVNTWWIRLQTLLRFQQDSTYLVRADSMTRLWGLFWRSPIWGYGPGSGLYNNDLGMINILVQYGLLGWLGVAFLIGSVLVAAFRAWQSGTAPVSGQGLLLGLLGMWFAVIAGYLYNINFFLDINYLGMAVGIALLLVEYIAGSPRPAERRTE